MFDSTTDEYILTSGPLPKSVYTYQLEALTRKLLRDVSFTLINTKKGTLIQFQGDDNPYNIIDIMKYANMEHLQLTDDDCLGYEKYLKTRGLDCSRFTKPQYKEKYPDLHPAEMRAISLYTGSAFQRINALLRGTYLFCRRLQAKRTILNTVFCGSALAKVSDTTIKIAYRGEGRFCKKVHAERMKAAKKKEVVSLSGFVSTSMKQEHMFGGSVKFILTNLKGKDVSLLSQLPEEQEFLIPPTQIQISRAEEKNGMCFIYAHTVTDLATIAPEKLFLTVEQIRLRDLKKLPGELEEYINKRIKHIKKSSHWHWFNKELSQKKLDEFESHLNQIKVLKDEIDGGAYGNDILTKVDEISRAIEATASIKRRVKDSKISESAKSYRVLKEQINTLRSPGDPELKNKP